ncbi:hypothetical protein AGMMS49579_26730 [Spirochaetia bacterium]|nr:hypothetical protein AGMMS49579_26730 [Spirochaetia bacterium]
MKYIYILLVLIKTTLSFYPLQDTLIQPTYATLCGSGISQSGHVLARNTLINVMYDTDFDDIHAIGEGPCNSIEAQIYFHTNMFNMELHNYTTERTKMYVGKYPFMIINNQQTYLDFKRKSQSSLTSTGFTFGNYHPISYQSYCDFSELTLCLSFPEEATFDKDNAKWKVRIVTSPYETQNILTRENTYLSKNVNVCYKTFIRAMCFDTRDPFAYNGIWDAEGCWNITRTLVN